VSAIIDDAIVEQTRAETKLPKKRDYFEGFALPFLAKLDAEA
jgi:hypothetical protein